MTNCKSETALNAGTYLERKLDLLETVRRFKASLGDGLNDAEFSCFLRTQHLPPEDGFEFLCFCDGCLTLSVPPQNEDSWHPRACWIAPAKEKTAAEFAERHGLYLSEPPDAALSCHAPTSAHHHLRFSNREETVVIAHPSFLKVRLYATGKLVALPWDKEILREISALYRDE